MYRTDFWTLGESEGGMFQENSIETCILSMAKEITSPGWMHETSARTWCTGKTQRDWAEREVGGGIRMGNTCKSMANSCQCMTKTLQYCKVISLQLIKINGKKKRKKWVIYTYVLRQSLSDFFIHDPQGKKYISCCDSVQTFIYIMEIRVSKTNRHRRHSTLSYPILSHSILIYSILFHYFPLFYYFSLSLPRSRPWDTGLNAISLLWRWSQETPVEWGDETEKAT